MQTVVFDLDKTLISGNISYLFGRFLYHRRFFSFFKMCTLVFVYLLHTLFLVSTDTLHAVSFRLFFFQKNAAEVNALAEEFIETALPSLVRASVLQRLQAAQLRGDQVMILSSSPDFLVRLVARHLLVAEFLATTYEIGSSNTFTKVGYVIDGAAKLKALSGYALNNVVAYSDSILDLPLLAAVGEPIAVFPDKKLRKIAQSRNWEILDQ